MHPETAERLLALNHAFYTGFGVDFSATRARLQPGVLRILETLRGAERILDLGCGNGELARTLSRRSWGGSYVGLDFSLPLLKEAGREAFGFPVQFMPVDLTAPDWHATFGRGSGSAGRVAPALAQAAKKSTSASEPVVLAPNIPALNLGQGGFGRQDRFDIVFCFAFLHHIPSFEWRLNLVRKVHELLKPDGRFFVSNWQFLESPRWKARIQPWDAIGLGQPDVDPNDYLLDWRRGGIGLRYVHHFDPSELDELAKESGFEIDQTYYSDGANKRSSLYQFWRYLEDPC